MQICIKLSPFISIDTSFYPSPGYGKLDSDNHTIIAIGIIPTGLSDYCFNTTQPGTYFAVQLDPMWQTIEEIQPEFKYFAGALYILVILGTIYQYLQLHLEKNVFKQAGERKYGHKILFLTVILIFSIARAVYWFSPDLGIAGDYLTFELPTFLFCSMYSSILYLWSEVVILTRKLRTGKTEVKTVFNLYVLFNLLLVVVFLVYVLLFNLWEDATLPCQINLSKASESKRIINTAYLITIGVITLGMALLFIVEGLMLFCYIFKLNKRRAKKKNMLEQFSYNNIRHYLHPLLLN